MFLAAEHKGMVFKPMKEVSSDTAPIDGTNCYSTKQFLTFCSLML